jgi:hypothetical protein
MKSQPRAGPGYSKTSSYATAWTLQFINNRATCTNGSGLYLEVNTKLYVLKTLWTFTISEHILYQDNHANYGGAII